MTPADKIAAYLDKILWKGPFHYRGVEYPADAQKVFIDTLVAVPAGENDLSVGDLKLILQSLRDAELFPQGRSIHANQHDPGHPTARDG